MKMFFRFYSILFFYKLVLPTGQKVAQPYGEEDGRLIVGSLLTL